MNLLKSRAFALMAIAAAATAVSAHAGETIYFVPGLDGGTKIITPWGDYLAIQDGSSIWVGTEQDYMDQKTDAISAQHGFKPVMLSSGGKQQRTYVNTRDLLSTAVGNVSLYSIDTAILFGVSPSKRLHRRPKKGGEEYVAIIWVQNQPSGIGIRIVASDSSRTFSPTSCVRSKEFYDCEFLMPREYLTSAVRYVFYTKGAAPAVLPVESIAKRSYKDMKAVLAGLTPDADQSAAIQRLHELDGSIPETLK